MFGKKKKEKEKTKAEVIRDFTNLSIKVNALKRANEVISFGDLDRITLFTHVGYYRNTLVIDIAGYPKVELTTNDSDDLWEYWNLLRSKLCKKRLEAKDEKLEIPYRKDK